MSEIGNLSFSVHLQDMTDADADKIKKKLENLSVSLKIDGNNIKVSNTDIIKKQIEDAVKSVNLTSVNFDASSIKSQLENVTQNFAPKAKVELLKDDLAKDLQSFIDTKTFRVKITITKKQLGDEIKQLGSFSIPATLKLSPRLAIAELKKSLSTYTVPIGVSIKSSSELISSIREKMKDKSIKIGIEPNKTILVKSINDTLKDKLFKADLKLNIRSVSVQQAIRDAFAKAGINYDDSAIRLREQKILEIQQRMALAQEKANKAHREGSQYANRYNSALQRINNTAERQKGLMAGIREQVANAYALYRVGRLLEGVIRISGEFQQQHVALQTILGDAQKADVLFQRIKNLAVESPFKFGDLTKYAKQLAAFSIPYEEMFDTLKRFGDLSAGLGVEMGRIILAYGQVRSAEFLKGTELRQFTEAGIPLVTELAKRYTELEGTLVSVGDVYDRISKKEVPFADVKAVLWDLTNEGGRFFNMQAVLTDTLKGKLDKLIDSYEIFLSEVGNSNNEILGGTLDMLTSILGHWKELQGAIIGTAVAYGSYKAAVLAVAAVQKVSMTLEVIQGIVNLTRVTQGLTLATKAQAAAQYILNAAMNVNPFVLAATAIGSLVGLILAYKNSAESTADSIARVNAEMLEHSDNSEQERLRGERLVKVMKNEKLSTDERRAAYDELNRMFPKIFENMNHHQVLLLEESRLHKMVGDAARKSAMEKSKATLDEEEVKLSKLKAEYDKQKKYFDENLSIRGYKDAPALKAAREAYETQLEVVRSTRDTYNEIYSIVKKIEQQRSEKWYVDSKKIAEDAGFKSLIPTDKETDVWEYFDRIKQGMDDIKKKKDMLDPKSANYTTMLGNLDTELKAYEDIYYNVLGGKNEEAIKAAEEARKKREKQLQDETKRNKKLGEEAAKAFADGVKSEMERIASQWDLYKQLFELTGDEQFASTAFKVTPIWDEAAKDMLDKFKESASAQGIEWDIDFDISDASAKEIYGDLYDSWKAIKDRIEKNGIDLKLNAANAINESKDFERQIEDVDRELQKTLKSIELVYGKGTPKYEKASAEAIRKAEEEKTKINFEEFKKSSDWVKVFDDLDRVSDATLDSMISKIEEFAKQAHLSEEVTKQLVEAMAKLRDETIERNPFEGFKDAWNRASYWRNYDVNAAYNKQYNDKTGKFEQKLSQEQVDNNLAEANDDLKDSALAVADKFQAVANAADMLSGLFENMGLGASEFMSTLSDVIGGGASGAQAGAGIAAAFGASGPWGAIIGAGIGVLSALFAQVDKSLQRSIEASERREKEIGNIAKNLEKSLERNMGGIFTMKLDDTTSEAFAKVVENYNKTQDALKEWNSGETSMTLFRQIRNFSHLQKDTIEAIKEALSDDSYYDAQYAALKIQRDEVQKQMDLEDEKKKTNKDKMLDYEQQIHELNDAIEHFAEDMANALYGIDFKDWSEQLAESLVDAWASGEDAVQAYKDTVNDILRDLGVSIISQRILEPLLEKTMTDFLAQFDKDDGKLTDASMEILAGMADGAEYAASATEAYLEGLKKLGIDLSDTSEEAKSGLSKGIEGVTEDTANLIGSYLQAIRHDSSVKRTLIEKLIGEDIPRMSYIAEAQLRELNQIVANTKRNADVATEIRDLFNRVVDKGSNKLKV